jgi:hypothetical protein
MSTAMRTNIFQIYYNQETQTELDPGFLPLDNTANERPDWREYWPIRRYLLENTLEDGVLYGFLSPKFKTKTNLAASDVVSFAASLPEDTDVAILSPYWDYMAFHWNLFEQGEYWHPGLLAIAEEFFASRCGIGKLSELIMTSRDTVYSNFFLARAPFWQRWLEVNEMLFKAAESGDGPLAEGLNRGTDYSNAVQYKVFIMERTASALLASEPRWRAVAYNPFQLRSSVLPLSKFKFEAILSDALKMAYAENGYPEYRNAFYFLRQEINKKVKL